MNYPQINLRAYVFCVIITLCTLVIPSHYALAQQSETPKPIIMPRLNPSPQPQPIVEDNHRIFNELIVPYLPTQSRNADIADQGKKQKLHGHGISDVESGIGIGDTLYAAEDICNDFNKMSEWNSTNTGDMWSDHFAGWGIFAVDDGWFYHADNVVFSREQAVGPGNKAGSEEFSLKIASNQPYAAGIGSPVISVLPGSLVTVRVKYLIFDHDTRGQDYDWVSLGIKPVATDVTVIYHNGDVRGQWAELGHTITAGESGEIMILIQAHSPAALNSNIYFDDIQIAVDGVYMTDCTYE